MSQVGSRPEQYFLWLYYRYCAVTKICYPYWQQLTSHYPREATGPNLNQIMMGSEGLWCSDRGDLRVFRYMPENRKRFSYIFKTEVAMAAAREMMQCEAGFSSVFRLSDPEETNPMLRLYNVDETPLWKLLDTRLSIWSAVCFLGFTGRRAGLFQKCGCKYQKDCLIKAMILTAYVTKSWEKGRFNDPYLRDTMMDFGIVTDTLECTVNWSNMGKGTQGSEKSLP